MNNPVDFSTASLLKEKGFPQNLDELTSKWFYYTGKYVPGSDMPYHEWKDYDGYSLYYKDFTWGNESNMNFYEAPTIAYVIMWLYEKYELWIEVYYDNSRKEFYTVLDGEEYKFKSPTEAYEVAIKYCLEYGNI